MFKNQSLKIVLVETGYLNGFHELWILSYWCQLSETPNVFKTCSIEIHPLFSASSKQKLRQSLGNISIKLFK